jgi:hypothetical protein
MKATIIFLLTALLGQTPAQMPKNNPNGIWESPSGTQYELRLKGTDLSVRLVPGSNPRFTAYEVELINNKDETNTYAGKGFFVAKVNQEKVCKFETEWQLTVVTVDRILGTTSNIIPDLETCTVKEKNLIQLDLKKKK